MAHYTGCAALELELELDSSVSLSLTRGDEDDELSLGEERGVVGSSGWMTYQPAVK